MSKQETTRRFRQNRIRPVARRWTFARIPTTTLDAIDAEARKWRVTRSDAIARLVARATAADAARGEREGVAA